MIEGATAGKSEDEAVTADIERRKAATNGAESSDVGNDYDECNGHVQAGELCGKCGRNRLNEESFTWMQTTVLPYYPPRLDCCQHAAIEINLDPDGRSPVDIIVSHNHSSDCDVWRYI